MTDREHEQLLTMATDRFERRLSEESAAVRITMVQQDAATRDEIASLRVNMTEQFAASRIQHESRHRELLKWAFAFWVGQALAVAGLFVALG
jgi:hypothetical protein